MTIAITPENISSLSTSFDDEFSSLSLKSSSNPTGVWQTTQFYPDGQNANPYFGSAALFVNVDNTYSSTQYNTSTPPWSVSSGQLKIEASPNSSLDSTHAYQSGYLIASPDYSQSYGYYEFNATLPSTQGWWPALWLYPTSAATSSSQEIDVLEGYTYASSVSAYSTLHSTATYPADPSGGGQRQSAHSAPYATGAAHTYGVDWEPDYITFYYDNDPTPYFRTPTPYGFENTLMSPVIDLAVGGTQTSGWFSSSPTSNAVGDMYVDYVREYNSAAISDFATGSSYIAPQDNVTRIVVTVEGNQTLTGNTNGDMYVLHLNDQEAAGEFENFAADTITNFSSGDSIFVGPTLTNIYPYPYNAGPYDYLNNDPQADHHIKFENDSSGNATVWLNWHPEVDGWTSSTVWHKLFTLTGVDASLLHMGEGDLKGLIVADTPTTGTSVSTSLTPYTAGAGVSDITLTGTSSQTVTANSTGDTFHSTNAGNHLIGGAGADTFHIGRAGDTVDGNGGADQFIFDQLPWAGAHITDFNAGLEDIDLTNMVASLKSAAATEVDITLVASGSDTAVMAHVIGSTSAGDWTVATLDGITASQLDVYVTQSGTHIHVAPTSTGSTVTTSASSYTAASGVTTVILNGTGTQSITANNLGDTFVSTNNGNTFVGGTGNDTFNLGRAGDIATGNGGVDHFVYGELPWAAGEIIGFDPVHETIDISGAYSQGVVSSTNPDITFVQSGANTLIKENVHGGAANGLWTIVQLDNVDASQLHITSGIISGAITESAVSTADSPYTAPNGVTSITLSGTATQTVTGNDLGDRFDSTNYGNHLNGGTGNDTFLAGRAGDTISTGAGHDTIVYREVPWAGGEITDFSTSSDAMDLTGLLSLVPYSGTDPVGDGVISIANNSLGYAEIDAHVASGPGAGTWVVAVVDHVSASSLHMNGAFITG
jgi:serralysin